MGRAHPLEVVWPLAPGGILTLAGLGLLYALRGPDVVMPATTVAAVLILLAA
jgi:hypothetical protein